MVLKKTILHLILILLIYVTFVFPFAFEKIYLIFRENIIFEFKTFLMYFSEFHKSWSSSRNNFQKIRSPWILVVFAQKLDGRHSKYHRAEKQFFKKISQGDGVFSHSFAKILFSMKSCLFEVKRIFLDKSHMSWKTL